MTLVETDADGVVVVKADGRIDMSSAEALTDALMSAVSRAAKAVIVDMSGVDYVSSAGLRAMMIACRAAKAANRAFAIAALRPLVLEIFTISRFNLVFPIYGGVGEAVEAVSRA